MDANNLVGIYPSIVGTRLDDCQTCHSGKIEDLKLAGSSCDNCHDLILHGTGHTAEETLNRFGLMIAPHGYMKSLPIEYVRRPFPPPTFYSGLDTETLGADCGLVTYPHSLPEGPSDGSLLPGEQWLMLGYERNGLPLETSDLDVTEGRIVGEGPLRLVVPQENPGVPDRGSRFSPSDCGDGFVDEEPPPVSCTCVVFADPR